jgi:anti-sigma B factor antagonist
MELYPHETDHDVLVLVADGGLNAETTPGFFEDIEKAAAAGVKRIIVDCTKLNYISSRGISALLGLHSRMKTKGADVKVAGARSFVLDALRVTHLDQVFDLHPDVDRARLAFRSKDA